MQFYYLNKNSEQAGPADLDQLKNAAITKDTLVWKEGMKDWSPAGTVEELKPLFAAATPPPLSKPAVPPPLPLSPKVNVPANPLSQKNLIFGGAVLLLLIAVAAFIFLKTSNEENDIASDTSNSDSALIATNDSTINDQEEKKDTVKTVDLDSLAKNLNWGETTTKTDTTSSNNNLPAFFPGAGTNTKNTSKPKKTTGKKPAKVVPEDNIQDAQPEQTKHTDKQEASSVNPVRYLSITGTYRRNIVFEAILEGTIQNRNSAQVRDIVIEVWFLDASGQSIGTKRFTQHGPLAAGASIPFKFKTAPPKGTKTARYEIASASIK